MAEINYPYITIDGTCIDIGDLCKNDFVTITNNFDYQTTNNIFLGIEDKELKGYIIDAVGISYKLNKTTDFLERMGLTSELNEVAKKCDSYVVEKYNETNTIEEIKISGVFDTAQHWGAFIYYTTLAGGDHLEPGQDNTVTQSDAIRMIHLITGIPEATLKGCIVPKANIIVQSKNYREVLQTVHDTIYKTYRKAARMIKTDLETSEDEHCDYIMNKNNKKAS